MKRRFFCGSDNFMVAISCSTENFKNRRWSGRRCTYMFRQRRPDLSLRMWAVIIFILHFFRQFIFHPITQHPLTRCSPDTLPSRQLARPLTRHRVRLTILLHIRYPVFWAANSSDHPMLVCPPDVHLPASSKWLLPAKQFARLFFPPVLAHIHCRSNPNARSGI